MSYILKFQSSPGLMVESLLNNSKHSREVYQYCEHCLRCHSIFKLNVQRWSSYVSALRALPAKRKYMRRREYESLNSKKDTNFKRLSELLRNLPKTTSRDKITNRKRSVKLKNMTESLGLKSCYIGSTTPYDPNLLPYSVEIDKVFRDFPEIKSHVKLASENYDFTGNKMNKEIESEEFNISRVLNVNKFKNLSTSCKILKSTEDKELFHKEDSLFIEPLTNKKEFKTLPTLPEKQRHSDFDSFSVSLSSDNSFISYLHSSVDICVTNEMFSVAIDLLQNCRKKNIWKRLIKSEKRNLLDIYNTLLYGLASKGEWEVIQTIKTWISADKLKLNCESFAALLLCLGNENKVRCEAFLLDEVLNEIFSNNISLNDIFSKTMLTKDQTEKILGVIHEVLPFFEISPYTIKLSSDCPLLQNLHKERNNMQSPIDNMKSETLGNLINEQLLMEKKLHISVNAVSKGSRTEATDKEKKLLDDLFIKWRKSLSRAITNVTTLGFVNQSSDLSNLSIYLKSIPIETHVEILLDLTQLLMEYSGGYSPSTSQLRYMLGHRVFQCYLAKKKDRLGIFDKTEKLFKQFGNWYLNPQGPARNSRQIWQMFIQDSSKSSQLSCSIVKWPDEVIQKLGKYLLDVIFNEVKFCRIKEGEERYHDGSWREEVKCHPSVSSLFEKTGFGILKFRADQMPMVCPPKPWTAADHGGYLILPTDFVRKPTHLQGKTIRYKDVYPQQMYATFDALNALQAVPWTINEDVLDVALELFRNGGSKKLTVPHFPEAVKTDLKEIKKLSFQEQMRAYKKKKMMTQQRMNDYGLWCEALYRLSLANHFRKRIFWLPQNCDFRGRVYPVPPLLNHLGADLFRSLLVFAKAKPIGPKGLDWVKIHLINLTGTHKKKTIQERLAYANEILPEIIDSADKPLTGHKWWTESDEPWQTLAACKEIKKIISSPNPEKFLSRFPIHQDGSCNGLQHYAALGKDLIGAESVNLASLDTPQDVYAVVADLVEKERVKDDENGLEVAQILKGFVERKVVKQTIMTTVYGVTPYGAKLQIAKRLEEIPNFPQDYIKPAAAYLSDKTFLCLSKMFTSAKEIQDWFIECANAICSMKDYVQWITPLGLPVLQSYGKFQHNSKLKEKIIVPDRMKQRNAFPPNFVHSLDSTHMMLTATFCEQAGLTFAAIHDCFWTHASTVEIMNRICREQFISLHSQPILEDLSQFFMNQYLQNNSNESIAKTFAAVPEKGNFNLQDVTNSVYFFS